MGRHGYCWGNTLEIINSKGNILSLLPGQSMEKWELCGISGLFRRARILPVDTTFTFLVLNFMRCLSNGPTVNKFARKLTTWTNLGIEQDHSFSISRTTAGGSLNWVPRSLQDALRHHILTACDLNSQLYVHIAYLECLWNKSIYDWNSKQLLTERMRLQYKASNLGTSRYLSPSGIGGKTLRDHIIFRQNRRDR